MRAATGPEPVRKAFEVHLVNLVEDRHHGLLNNLVLQRRDAQRTLPPVGLRNIDSSRGLCPIRSTVHPAVQIDESILQSGFILLPRHAIDSRCSLALQGVEAVPQQIDGQMVEQSGEPFLLPFSCCLPHTVQPLGHALPALCRVHAGWNDVLLGLCPSLPSLRRRLPLLVRLVHGYYGTVRLLLNVHVRRSVYGLRGPVLLAVSQDVQELSRFSCMLFLSVRGFLDYAGPNNPLAINVAVVLPSSSRNGVGILFQRLFEAQ